MAAPAVLAGTSAGAGAGGGSEFGAGGVAEPSLAFHRRPPGHRGADGGRLGTMR